MKNNGDKIPAKLARRLVLNEVFDLALYRRLLPLSSGATAEMLRGLTEVETKHVKFWQDFLDLPSNKLDFPRRVKLSAFVLFARLFGEQGIHLLVEAIEIHGIRNYLSVWEIYKDQPPAVSGVESLGNAVRGVLLDEFQHEDEIVALASSRRIHPERVRDIFLGLNDGLVEIVGAASGFFAAFQTATAVLIAGFTVAIAGAISMAAGTFAAVSSEQEIEEIETKRKRFLGGEIEERKGSSPYVSGAVVGISYFLGATVPILPVFFGEQNFAFSVAAALAVAVLISYFLAFISGMSVAKRIGTNIAIIAIAVAITYAVGIFAKNVFGIKI